MLLNHITLPPRNLDGLLFSDNPYFHRLTGQIYPTEILINKANYLNTEAQGQIYPTEIQINKADSLNTEAPFLDLDLSITNDLVPSKIYDKCDI